MINSKTLILTTAISLAMGTSIVSAQDSIVGQVRAESHLVLNPGAAQQTISGEALSYLQGDVVSTKGAKSARIILNSGELSIVMAPNSVASINSVEPVTVNLQEGSVGFNTTANQSVVLVSANGTYTVSSNAGASAVAVLDNGNLAIVSQEGELTVESDADNSIMSVADGKVFISDQNNQAKVVNVAVGAGVGAGLLGGVSTAAIVTTVAAVVVAGVVIENNNDDDSPAN